VTPRSASGRDREHAVSYAEWIARELDRAEIRVYNPDGSLAERRVIDNAGNRGTQPAFRLVGA
jgi:hypothetical protein